MKPKTKLFLAVILGLVLLAVLGVAIAKAADAARPGDLLFPVDKALENLERSLIPGRKDDIGFETEILEERAEELREIEEEAVEVEDDAVFDSIQNNIEDAEQEVSDQEDRLDTLE